MKYEGVSCETCGWGTTGFEEGVSVDHSGVTCHHSANMSRAAESLPKLWWCDKWVSQEQAKAWFVFRAQPGFKIGIFDSWAVTKVEP